ncbi:bestrophin family protein [Filimonas effusa]|uniref:Bestrophin n=1 Tax=Filimonas effusa TaxID=2508721 RepID=A0A4Q1D0H4_9BACT|nr:bestrophin family ion channel [Filimonas effusa]RXK80724.1 hypothetical protein ESB13_21395 [Filimonas effusa]
MMISTNFRLSRIVQYTWKTDLVITLSCVAAYFIDKHLLVKHFVLPAIVPTVLGSAIAFFIGFNNNQAYDRWWEARKIWGALVNDSRSWARNVLSYVNAGDGNHDVKTTQKIMICRHLAFIYALKSALRPQNDNTFRKFLSPEEHEKVIAHSNVHNAILVLQSQSLQQLSEQNAIDGFRFLELNQMLVNFTDSMGQAERIKNTVFPTIYIFFTRVFIWLFTILFTIVCAHEIGAWSILMGAVVGFVFHITHYNGITLINPFSTLTTSISLNQICRTIEINLLEMLGEEEIPQPVKPINNEYIM